MFSLARCIQPGDMCITKDANHLEVHLGHLDLERLGVYQVFQVVILGAPVQEALNDLRIAVQV